MIGSFHLDGMPEMLDGQLHALLLLQLLNLLGQELRICSTSNVYSVPVALYF